MIMIDYIRYYVNKLMRISILSFFFAIIPIAGSAQPEKKYIRQGNREYEKSKFQESEISYRRAVDGNKGSANAIFNIGDALYKQNKYDEAAKHFSDNINMNDDPERRSAAFYNLGNSLLKANKLKESIEAYKGSLKLNPDNFEAKYNLAYAQDLLKQQQEQEQQQKDQDNQKDKDQNNDKDQQQENKENQDQKQDQQQEHQSQQEQSISKEDAERLLNSLANDERKVQEKVKLARAAQERKKTVKNW
jgi:tetratricopeptide (TPR) repeat protein